jgi:hypothetical protein
MAAQLTLTKGPFDRVAVVMNGVGHQFFSGAAFPANQDGGVAAGHLADHLEHFSHLVAVADNVVDAVLVFQFVPQALVFLPQQPLFPDGWSPG